MRKYLFLSIVSLLSVASCTVQEILFQEVEPAEAQDVYHAGFGDFDTKTAIDGLGRMYWENGDEISVFRSTANVPYIYEGETGARLADFKRADDSFYAGQDIPATIAVYPYAYANAVTDDGTGVYVNFSSNQYYVEGSFGRSAAPMVAVTKDANDRDLNFKNLAGFLVIPAYGDVTVKKVEFIPNGEALPYRFVVEPKYGEDPVLHQEEYYTSLFRLDCTQDPVKLSKDNFTEFWLALPPVTMKDGFTVKFVTSDGEFNFTTNASRTISRNVVNRMTPVSVSSAEVPWEYFEDPSTGKPMVFTFTQNWWGETAEGYIKYRTVGNVRVCQTETFPHGEYGYGFWGQSSSPEEAVEWSFLWHLDSDTLELPSQFTGFFHTNYNAELLVFDLYHYNTDLAGKVLPDWDECYNEYPHGYYDGNGGFYLYVYYYYMIGVGGWGVNDYDTILEAQTYFDRREYWVNIYEETQVGADKYFGFDTGRTVSRVWYTVAEGYLSDSEAFNLAQSVYGGDMFVDVSGQYASISVNPGVSGKYTLVAITDGGEFSYLHFEYTSPEDAAMDVTITVSTGYIRGRSMDYVIKGTGLTEAHMMVLLTELVPEDLTSWANRYNALGEYEVSAINGYGYAAGVEGLTPGRSYTLLLYASNGVYGETYTAEFVTESRDSDYQAVASGVYQYSAWWNGTQNQTLYRDSGMDNTFVIPGWGGLGVDFTFVWNQDNTLSVPIFDIGTLYDPYGPIYYMESRDYFAGQGLDDSDDRMKPSFYENGVFNFHFVMFVSAGRFGDFWETFTLDEIPGFVPSLYAKS